MLGEPDSHILKPNFRRIKDLTLKKVNLKENMKFKNNLGLGKIFWSMTQTIEATEDEVDYVRRRKIKLNKNVSVGKC